MPTTLPEVEEQLRVALGLTPQQAKDLIVRIVPTLQVIAVRDTSGEVGGVNAAAGRATTPGVAGQYAQCQLMNPAGSGTILLVSAVSTTIDNTAYMYVRRYDTPLGTLQTEKTWVDFRRSGAPVAEVRKDNDAVQQGVVISVIRRQSDNGWLFTYPTPLVLPPGTGILTNQSTVAQILNTSFWWTEEAA